MDNQLRELQLLIGVEEPSVFKDYVDHVANKTLIPFKNIRQWGGKQGESLYTHVLNGIFILEQLRPLLDLTDIEARVLYTAFTVHDINKFVASKTDFGRLAVADNVGAEIERLGLAAFFPDWRAYLEDITTLIREHGGHLFFAGSTWIAKHGTRFGLGRERVMQFVPLMRAADNLDLSHTLDERTHKDKFLSELNAYLSDIDRDTQYAFCAHRLSEARGILTNVIHNAIVVELRDEFGLIPLLFYPDGIAYLVERGQLPTLTENDLRRIAGRVAETVNTMAGHGLDEFIETRPMGIKIDAKCLALAPFDRIWKIVYNRVQQRKFKIDELRARTVERARSDFARNAATWPEAADEVASMLESGEVLASQESELRRGELARSYYIFLLDHFAKAVPQAWQRIYTLLDLPSDRYPIYAYFDARSDRAYVLARDITLSEEEVYQRIQADGAALMGQTATADEKVDLFTTYLARYASFSFGGAERRIENADLRHYVRSQHKQCVHCSADFPTDKWMAGDVRSDITVQTFSNRLRGGPGEPKKNICAVCQIQFLLEKLNYQEVRDEDTMYLHLFPYSFLTGPFLAGLQTTVRRITQEDTAVRALNLRSADAIQRLMDSKQVELHFAARTREGKLQPYGLYLPRYAETVSNLLIFPINPAGGNDSERFLFALWNALLLQRHLGCKVLLSDSPIAPLGKEEFGDVLIDNAPLACRGLVAHNDYHEFENGGPRPGTLQRLWQDVDALFTIRRIVSTATTRRDEMLTLVQALGLGPLDLFYTTEKLLEARVRGDHKAEAKDWLLARLSQQVFRPLTDLAYRKGGPRMEKLGTQLERLARIAWEGHLRGKTLQKNSLVTPLDEVFVKLNHPSQHADMTTTRAAMIQDLVEHLERVYKGEAQRQRPGSKRIGAASEAFVDAFLDGVFNGVYGGNVRKLLADEKLIRSAFLFYVRQQIPRKGETAADEMGADVEPDNDSE